MSIFGWISNVVAGVGNLISRVGKTVRNETLTHFGSSISSFGQQISGAGSSDPVRSGAVPASAVKSVKPVTPPDMAEVRLEEVLLEPLIPPVLNYDDQSGVYLFDGLEVGIDFLRDVNYPYLWRLADGNEMAQEVALRLALEGVPASKTHEQYLNTYAWYDWNAEDDAFTEAVVDVYFKAAQRERDRGRDVIFGGRVYFKDVGENVPPSGIPIAQVTEERTETPPEMLSATEGPSLDSTNENFEELTTEATEVEREIDPRIAATVIIYVGQGSQENSDYPWQGPAAYALGTLVTNEQGAIVIVTHDHYSIPEVEMRDDSYTVRSSRTLGTYDQTMAWANYSRIEIRGLDNTLILTGGDIVVKNSDENNRGVLVLTSNEDLSRLGRPVSVGSEDIANGDEVSFVYILDDNRRGVISDRVIAVVDSDSSLVSYVNPFTWSNNRLGIRIA